MKLICLQAGHEGRTSGATGAPGEQELTIRIRNALFDVLTTKGFQVQKVNADPKASEIDKDFDLFLAIHGDANVYGTGGGFVDFPEPSTDGATQESQRIAGAIAEEYFKHSQIINHPERSNKNTRFYYMWKKLSAKTPCVIIELGVVTDAHDKVLLNDTQRITGALARGICKAFGVSYEEVNPPPMEITDQTKIPQIVDENGNAMEVQRIRSLLSDRKRDLEAAQKRIRELEAVPQAPTFNNPKAILFFELAKLEEA